MNITGIAFSPVKNNSQETKGKNNYQTSSIENSKKLTKTLDNLAFCNASLIKNNNQGVLIDEYSGILDGFKEKPLADDFSNLSAKNTVLVHMSDFFPKDGKILCAMNFGKTENGLSKSRSSVHFTLNNISPELTGDPSWKNKKYGIIMPADKTIEKNGTDKIYGGIPDDFAMSGDVEIPEGSVIVLKNSKIPEDSFKVYNSKELKGVKIVETSNSDMNEVIPNIIEKMGYTTIETDTYTKDKMKAWHNLAKAYDFPVTYHQNSYWGKTDSIIDYIHSLKFCDNSWFFVPEEKFLEALNKQFNFVENYFEEKNGTTVFNYKKCFSNELEKIKKEVPKEKIGYDIDKMIEIINKSKTPSEALDEIKNNLKLIPMRSDEDANDSAFDVYIFAFVLDAFMLATAHSDALKEKYIQ